MSHTKEYRASYYQKNKKELLEKQKLYYLENIEDRRAYNRQYANENIARKMLHAAKSRTVEKNLPRCDLSIEDIEYLIPEFCPILGMRLKRGIGTTCPESPTLDRIIPELGYTKGNIQVISSKANIMKSNASNEELLRFADWIRRNINNTND